MFHSFGNRQESQESIRKMLIRAFEEHTGGMTDAEYAIAVRNLPPELKRNSSLGSTDTITSESPNNSPRAKPAQNTNLRNS